MVVLCWSSFCHFDCECGTFIGWVSLLAQYLKTSVDMAPKHARTGAGPSSFDVRKFVSAAAAKRFEESVVKRSGIPERVLNWYQEMSCILMRSLLLESANNLASYWGQGCYKWSESFMQMPTSTHNLKLGFIGRKSHLTRWLSIITTTFLTLRSTKMAIAFMLQT